MNVHGIGPRPAESGLVIHLPPAHATCHPGPGELTIERPPLLRGSGGSSLKLLALAACVTQCAAAPASLGSILAAVQTSRPDPFAPAPACPASASADCVSTQDPAGLLGRLPGDVGSLGEFLADLRLAGARRLVVAGDTSPGNVISVVDGFASSGAVSLAFDKYLTHADAKQLGPKWHEFDAQRGDSARPLKDSFEGPGDAVLWTQYANAVCRPEGLHGELACPEGSSRPPQTPISLLRETGVTHAETFDLYRRSNAMGLPAILVVPREHWTTDGRLLRSGGTRFLDTLFWGMQWTKEPLLQSALQLPDRLIGEAIIERAGIPEDSWGASVAFELVHVSLDCAIRFLASYFLGDWMLEPVFEPAPDRQALLANVTAMGDVVLPDVDGTFTIIGPAQFREAFERFAARNPAPATEHPAKAST